MSLRVGFFEGFLVYFFKESRFSFYYCGLFKGNFFFFYGIRFLSRVLRLLKVFIFVVGMGGGIMYLW